MPNTVTVKLSNAKDFIPHANLVVDDWAMELIMNALLSYANDKNRNTVTLMYEEIRAARRALELINPK